MSWPSCFAQFGSGFKTQKNFKAQFLIALRFALTAYPAANVSVTDTGLILHPSRPAVEKRPDQGLLIA
jgi:hypothetical protein